MRRLRTIVLSLLPFAVVAALLYAAVFVKVEPKIADVPRPMIEARDHFFGIARAADASIWVVGNDGKILHSSDDGARWQAQRSGTREVLQSVAAWTAQDAVAVGEQRTVLYTRDAGARWAPGAVPADAGLTRLGRVVAQPGGVALAAGDYGYLIRTGDFGQSWQVAYQGDDVMWNDLAVRDQTWIAVGEFGAILRSGDGGHSWSPVESPADRSLTSASFLPDGDVLAVGLDGLVLRSSDDGASWTLYDAITDEHLFIVRANGKRWVAIGDKGIWAAGDLSGDSRVFRLGEFDRRWRTDMILAGPTLIAVGEGICVVDASLFGSSSDPNGRCRGPCDSPDACLAPGTLP